MSTFKCSPSFSFHFIRFARTLLHHCHTYNWFSCAWRSSTRIHQRPSLNFLADVTAIFAITAAVAAAAVLLLTIIVFDARDIQCHRLTHVHSNRKRACWFRRAFVLFLNHCALFNCSSFVKVQLSITVDFKSNSRIQIVYVKQLPKTHIRLASMFVDQFRWYFSVVITLIKHFEAHFYTAQKWIVSVWIVSSSRCCNVWFYRQR